MNKLNIWIIDKDDEIMIKQLKDILEAEKLLNRVNIKHIKKFIVECMDLEGTPDIIFIDTTAIQGEMPTPYGCYDTIYHNLRYFVRKHTSSIIVVASYVKSWATDFLEDLKGDFRDEAVVECCENGARGIFETLKKYLEALK